MRFQAPLVASMKTVFWFVVHCSLAYGPNNGSSKHFWNVSEPLPDYMEKNPEESHHCLVLIVAGLTFHPESHLSCGLRFKTAGRFQTCMAVVVVQVALDMNCWESSGRY